MGGRSQTRSSQRLNSKTVPDPQGRDESAEKGIWPETARGKQATPSPTLGTRGTRGCRNTEGPRPEAAGRSCSRGGPGPAASCTRPWEADTVPGVSQPLCLREKE
ncbi:hypothetical protein PAL_GLEAN10022960 [Pteropus alecto]|uniref:Uncharacterized protein n=1 Tax=Pteropus alecto TaxID=9402 RepID=L5K4X6_PTEAL|nr:hypothetical protein PAL_GLEAN10022960 [Pteropus alecto]